MTLCHRRCAVAEGARIADRVMKRRGKEEKSERKQNWENRRQEWRAILVKPDGVAKNRQLLCCCNGLAASTFVSTPHCSTIAHHAGGDSCLAIHVDTLYESIKPG